MVTVFFTICFITLYSCTSAVHCTVYTVRNILYNTYTLYSCTSAVCIYFSYYIYNIYCTHCVLVPNQSCFSINASFMSFMSLMQNELKSSSLLEIRIFFDMHNFILTRIHTGHVNFRIQFFCVTIIKLTYKYVLTFNFNRTAMSRYALICKESKLI